MFTTYIKNLNDMVFSTVSEQVLNIIPACLCNAERSMAVLDVNFIYFSSPACSSSLCS